MRPLKNKLHTHEKIQNDAIRDVFFIDKAPHDDPIPSEQQKAGYNYLYLWDYKK
jgi:hypothetical protein